MKKSTKELLHEIASEENILSYLEKNEGDLLDETAEEYLRRKMLEKNLAVADIARRSSHGDYVYKVFSGRRRASRDILVAIAFGMSMTADETQTLLRLSGTARLDPRAPRDAVALHALLKKRDLMYLNDILFDMGEAVY
ncbi:MAG: hypothetical protein LBT08_01265 [Synergistaceae bacterium]|jgi:hypothetical protein|nr:hypothetical protein [Synergistaceae bacterium]